MAEFFDFLPQYFDRPSGASLLWQIFNFGCIPCHTWPPDTTHQPDLDGVLVGDYVCKVPGSSANHC